jgi:hypothetical protein
MQFATRVRTWRVACLYCVQYSTVQWNSFATSRKVEGSIPDEVIWFFESTWSFQLHYDPGVDSASNRN